MALATWWRGYPPVDLAPVAEFRARPADDAALARLAGLTSAAVQEPRRAGHRPYVGYRGATAATYGWVAKCGAFIGELSLAFSVPEGDRYLGM